MGSEVEACAECSRKCLLIHRKHDHSVLVNSFFKVMYGKHFSTVVMLPPRFTRLASLVAQKTYLEDSCGRTWDVILSDIDGSLGIQKGWTEFLVDHGIQMGDFVVFHYIIGSHFLVQLYGPHGCEKLSLCGENTYQNKRAKSNACSSFNELNVVKEPVAVKINASSKMYDFVGDTQFIINDQDHLPREDDRDHLFDLSIFETPEKTQVLDALQKTRIWPAPNSSVTKKYRAPEANTLSKHLEAFTPRKQDNTSGGRRTPVVKQEPKAYTPDFISKPMVNTSAGIIEQKLLSSNMLPGVEVEMIKQELQESSQELFGNVNLARMENDDGIISKPEPVDLCDPSSSTMAKITCSVLSVSEPFLVLPECLPMKGAEFQSRCLLLQDPLKRVWPVLYHHKFGVKVLASGWKAFRDANSIKAGEECTLAVENVEENKLLVEILRGKRQ